MTLMNNLHHTTIATFTKFNKTLFTGCCIYMYMQYTFRSIYIQDIQEKLPYGSDRYRLLFRVVFRFRVKKNNLEVAKREKYVTFDWN